MKKILLTFVVGMFLISYVSAMDWDNKIEYKNNDLTAEIYNSNLLFLKGEKLGEVTLTSHSLPTEIRNVVIGKDRAVMYYDFKGWELYKNGLGDVTFTNMKNGEEIDRDYYFAKAVYEEVEVPYYKDICDNGKCVSEFEGIKTENKFIRWEKLDTNDILKGDMRIALITEVRKNDYIDGVWKIAGKKITKHASWTESLNDDIQLVYRMDNESIDGASAVEAIEGVNNISGFNSARWIDNGVIDGAYNTTEAINTTISLNDMNVAEEWTMLMWAKAYDDVSGNWLSTEYSTTKGGIACEIGAGATITCYLNGDGGKVLSGNTAMGIGAQGLIVLTVNLTHASLYVNGSLIDIETEDGWAGHDGAVVLWGNKNLDNDVANLNIDETIFWNRSLTASEISDIWTDTLSYNAVFNVVPTVTLNSPLNQSKNNTGSLNFNCTSSDDRMIENISLFINAVRNYTVTDGVDNFTQLNITLEFPDGDYTWTCDTWDNESEQGTTETRAFSVDTIIPNINITTTTPIDYHSKNTNLTINWTVSDTHLDSCWLDYNSVNYTQTCSNNGTSINITSVDESYLLFWANDSFNSLNHSEFNWTYNLFENSQTFSSTAYETEKVYFIINISHDASEILTANFYYNNTNRGVATKQDYSGGTIFNKTIDVALTGITTNQSFFWDLNYGSLTTNTTARNQTVSPIFFRICNTTVNQTALNFTLIDEETGIQINASETSTSYEAGSNYWLGEGEIYKNHTYSLLKNETVSNYTYCIYPADKNFTVSLNSIYSVTGYSEREYNLGNATVYNTTSHIALLVLNDSDSVKFTITVKEGVSELTGAYVTVSKYFTGEGKYKTISIRTTDNLGQFIEYLELDKDYKFSVVKSGELLGIVEKRSTCSASPCEMTLQIDASQSDIWSSYYDYYADNIVSNLSFNQTNRMVTYDFIDITGLANYFRLEVYQVRYNETQNIICNNNSYSSAGTLLCNLTAYDGDFLAKTYISRSPEKVDKVLAIIISEIAEDLGLLGLFLSVVIVITLVFAGGIISQGNPTVMASLFGLAILATKLMMILPFSWAVVSLIELLVIFIAALTRT